MVKVIIQVYISTVLIIATLASDDRVKKIDGLLKLESQLRKSSSSDLIYITEVEIPSGVFSAPTESAWMAKCCKDIGVFYWITDDTPLTLKKLSVQERGFVIEFNKIVNDFEVRFSEKRTYKDSDWEKDINKINAVAEKILKYSKSDYDAIPAMQRICIDMYKNKILMSFINADYQGKPPKVG